MQPFQMTPKVVQDINRVVGADYTADMLTQFVGFCFSQIDFDFFDQENKTYPCRDCRIQLACGIHRAEKSGVRDARGRFLPGTKQTISRNGETFDMFVAPAELIDAITSAKKPPLALVPDPDPAAVAPDVGAVAPPLISAPQPPASAPPLPPAPPVPAASTAVSAQPPPPLAAPPPPAPSPNELAAAISPVPLNGTAPDGWPNLDRDRLVAICLALGYTEQDVFKKRVGGLIKMVVDKKPEWSTEPDEPDAPAAVEPPPPVPVEPETVEPSAKLAAAPEPVMSKSVERRLAAQQAPTPQVAALVPPESEPRPVETKLDDLGDDEEGAWVDVDVQHMKMTGRADNIAKRIAEVFGDLDVEVEIRPFDE